MIIKYIEDTQKQTGLSLTTLLKIIGINKTKYYNWKERTGVENRHNSNIPKSNWLLEKERIAIIKYAKKHSEQKDYMLYDGYRRLTYKMLDENIVAVSSSTVYRVLRKEGLLNKWSSKKSIKKGKGFKQPEKPHKDWHIDIKYVNYRGTFLFLISIIDGYSRFIVNHRLCENMRTQDVMLVIQEALEKYSKAKPKIISDNGSQFIAKDFNAYLKIQELKQIRTSVAYPQSNGKIERFHRSINNECLKTKSFIDLEDAKQQINNYINFYNTKRLHSALFYLTPEDFLLGRVTEKLADRKSKLEKAYQERKRLNLISIAA